MCTYPFAKKALTIHLARGESRERYFGCNLMQRKVLASSHQHLMAEAPADLVVLRRSFPEPQWELLPFTVHAERNYERLTAAVDRI